MSLEAEQAVIGALMLLDLSSESSDKVFSMLRPSSFADGQNQLIYAAIQRLSNNGGYADILTLGEECKRDKRFSADIDDYLCELVQNTPTAENVVGYAEVVRQAAIQRFATTKLNEALAIVSDPYAGDVYKRIGQAEEILSAIQERSLRNKPSGLVHAKDVGRAWLPEVTDRVENGIQRGFTLGVSALDELLLPKRIPAGSLVVIGARPKAGKTAAMARIVDHFACERKETAAVFSLEMPNQQIYERMITGASRVDPGIFYRPARSADDWSAVTAAASRYNAAELYFDDTPGATMAHVRREVRKLNMRTPVKLVAVDYLTLMKAGEADRNDLAYGDITKALKNLAKEIDGVVLLLTQLNRNLENRPDKRPMPSDSRDTGQIEQDCDLWIGLYREAVYKPDAPSESLTEMIVRLNRHGKAGTVFVDAVNGTVQEVDQDWARDLMFREPDIKPRRMKV